MCTKEFFSWLEYTNGKKPDNKHIASRFDPGKLNGRQNGQNAPFDNLRNANYTIFTPFYQPNEYGDTNNSNFKMLSHVLSYTQNTPPKNNGIGRGAFF